MEAIDSIDTLKALDSMEYLKKGMEIIGKKKELKALSRRSSS